MESNNDYKKSSPARSQPIVFQDPFADPEGGVGNLTIVKEASRAHASSNAASTISAHGAIFDRDDDSAAASSMPSTTAISRECSPSKTSPEKSIQGDNLSISLPPRDNDFILPCAELGPLDEDPFASPASFGSTQSFDPDITPRSCSNIGYHDRNASFDGGAELLKSYGSRISPIPFTTSPASMTRTVSFAASIQSFKSAELTNDEWNTETLREMTDVIREAVELGSIPSTHLDILSEILRALLIDELSQVTAVSIDLIALTYFDKTLDAILSHAARNIAIADPSIQGILSRATSLQHKWQQRFKERYETYEPNNLLYTRGSFHLPNSLHTMEQKMLTSSSYFTIDDVRIKDMWERALQGLSLSAEDWKADQVWLATYHEPISHQQGDLGFEVGRWWLNIACAFRDGIVGGANDMATKGPYNVTALPLLSGEEMEGPTLGMYQYFKTGTSKEMPFSTLGNRGGPVRILRGHALKSRLAPRIGVRYDGLYVIRQYGHKLVDPNQDIYKCRLVLERVTGQKSINDIIVTPTPSQLDDWALYNRIVGEHIRACQGDFAYSEWRIFLERQIVAKEEHIQKKELEASFPRHKLVSRKKINSQ